MKIAYYLHMNMELNSGVVKKVLRQAEEWERKGHEVGLFVATNRNDLHLGLKENSLIKFITLYKSKSKFDGLGARIRANAKVVSAIGRWQPDVVYTRQDTFLPAHLNLLLKHKVVLEINTNDLGELQASSVWFKMYYSPTRLFGLLLSKGVVFVSNEISELPHYRFVRHKKIIGNGFRIRDVDKYIDSSMRDNNSSSVRLAFIGHPNQPWHGVDKIVALASIKSEWEFDIIGIDSYSEELPTNVHLHGNLNLSSYAEILIRSTCALGTLALHRNNMMEASPLKNREYLAFGLPIISGHVDTDFSSASDFILNLGNYESNVIDNVDAIEKFVSRWRGQRVRREEILHLDYSKKEDIRIKFFLDLVNTNA